MISEVFFADLAGFTKWSSTRTPSDVFQLLETLYGAVSTIGVVGHSVALSSKDLSATFSLPFILLSLTKLRGGLGSLRWKQSATAMCKFTHYLSFQIASKNKLKLTLNVPRFSDRAVTGLPVPQDNHAMIMTRFAASCIVKLNQLVNDEDILSSLGNATANLEMRVGMHR